MIIAGQITTMLYWVSCHSLTMSQSDTCICGRTQTWEECTLPWADEVWQLDRNYAIRLPSNASQSDNPANEKLRQCKLSLQTSTHQHWWQTIRLNGEFSLTCEHLPHQVTYRRIIFPTIWEVLWYMRILYISTNYFTLLLAQSMYDNLWLSAYRQIKAN